MGIKGLWTVLTPYSEKKSLHEIRGETLAVDLSGWVCDSQNVTDYYIQPKLYLRNLFFRTIYLLLADIKPIFVLEGDAPELKRDVMAARNAIQFRGAAPKTDETKKKKPDVGRKRFKNVLKECENLLRCMGVVCVKGCGEAEATCADLNAFGLVDAVISQDSDCFAYGARRVYRNFSVSNSAGGGALQGSVDCYDAGKMYQHNGFGRNKMVALALLCGCDYGVGACGSSITTAVTFLNTVPDGEIIPRLLSWVTDVEHYEERSRFVSAGGRCDRCGHVGRTHARNGCPVCGTNRSCNDYKHKEKLAEIKRELSLRNRALSCGLPFPEPKVMKEFLDKTREKMNVDGLKNPVPSLIQFVKLMTHKLDWSERYCVEKFLPLLTKWHLQDHVPSRSIKPVKINKKRNPRGIPSFEVIWGDIDGQYDGLVPDDQIEEDEDRAVIWTTTERQDLLRKFYPNLVNDYEESIKKPVKEKKTRRKKVTNAESVKPKRKHMEKSKKVECDEADPSSLIKETKIQRDLENSSSAANVSVSINKLKRKHKSDSKRRQRTIDSFIANKKRKSIQKSIQSLRDSFKRMSIVNYQENDDENKRNTKEINEKEDDFTNFSVAGVSNCEIEEDDLSAIIDQIVNRSPIAKTALVDKNWVKLVFDKNKNYSTPKKKRRSILTNIANHCSTPNQSPLLRQTLKIMKSDSDSSFARNCNTSQFFDKLTDVGDAFELSMENVYPMGNLKLNEITNLELDTTVEYSLPDVCL